MSLLKLWQAYGQALETSPIKAQMLSSAIIWCAGDLSAQWLEHRAARLDGAQQPSCVEVLAQSAPRTPPSEQSAEDSVRTSSSTQPLRFDWRRTTVQTVYAAVVWAPVAHHWYEALDRVVLKMASAGSRRFVAAKLGLEMVALHPVSLLAFFGCVGVANGEPVGQVAQQIKRDLVPSLLLEWLMWAPLDIANFACVPVRHQLLVTNCGCFAESIALSFVKANGFALPGEAQH
uniref:Uncharacterized protein n=1 Tax=Chrysotila carterae TaxID=13221 RepID=A0A7S4C1H2_CHRCT|mmetsp:Transcript_57433/g.124820  ORF Transcript_57433/g.124820 Transcript_57433/m.124820 type:complete len:232 (+) Transcript_57433:188-883(+)